MAGEIHHRGLPCTRGLDPVLRGKRLHAARQFKPRSIPRTAIMLGHWDRGSVVGAARQEVQRG